MKRTILFFLKYFAYWLGYFLVFKTLFLLANIDKTALLPAAEWWGIYAHGIRMDLSAAGYFCVLPGVLLALTPWCERISKKIIGIYTYLMLGLLTLLGLTDIGLYPEWGTRVNAMLLPYLATPKGVIYCLLWWQWLLAFVAWGVLTLGCAWVYHRLFASKPQTDQPRWYTAPTMLLLTGALILPVRGGIDTSPLNFSSVYFSKNLYANHCAYNFFWGFSYSVLNNDVNQCPVHYMDESQANAAMQGVAQWSTEPVPQYIKTLPDNQQPNVILILLESFSDRVIGGFGGTDYAPCLSKLCSEGIMWPNFYAVGNRSDKGVSAVLAGYPALIGAQSVLGFPDKMAGLDYLPRYFADHGYQTSFYYGGDINFYNVHMLLVQAMVEQMVERSDFPVSVSAMQKWGVPDEYLYERFWHDINNMWQPFFAMSYNISSHPPFDIPAGFNRIAGNSQSDKYCNSIAYSDSVLGAFVDSLKASPLWDNTLVIITSDHTTPLPEPLSGMDEPEAYHIPCLWLGGVLDSAFVCPNVCMQTDLSATLIQQLGWPYQPSCFSKNMFGSHQYALYYRNEAWGFISPESAFATNMESGQRTFFWGEDALCRDSLEHFAEGFTQYLHLDFHQR